jgi:copper chaperone CopZ
MNEQEYLKPRVYYYPIEGINCHACAFVIREALAEAGIEGLAVDLAKHELVVPAEKNAEIAEIKKIVDNSGHYNLNIKAESNE